MSFEYINKSYGVNACVGRRVVCSGEPGVIVGAKNTYIIVNLDSNKASQRDFYHPTFEVEYQGMGKVRKLTAGQKRYQEYLDADTCETFAEWLGVDKYSKQRCEYLKNAGYI